MKYATLLLGLAIGLASSIATAAARAITNVTKLHERYERIERAYIAAFALGSNFYKAWGVTWVTSGSMLLGDANLTKKWRVHRVANLGHEG
jgi:hypothetical protein